MVRRLSLNRDNVRFDTRVRLIAHLRMLTQPQLSDYFQQVWLSSSMGWPCYRKFPASVRVTISPIMLTPLAGLCFPMRQLCNKRCRCNQQSKEIDGADDRREP